jgi:hypothetical protein
LISQDETPGEHFSKFGDQIKNYFTKGWQKGDKRVHWAFECSWVLSLLPPLHAPLLGGARVDGWMDDKWSGNNFLSGSSSPS